MPSPLSRNSDRMADTNSSQVLQRLFIILNRSFAMYLAGAYPWTHRGDEQARKVLDRIVADQRMYAGRVAEMLLDRRVTFAQGEYPMAFTDTHDLSLDYLVSELIAYQKQDIADLERCVAASTDSAVRALAEEILGNARGHLQSLQELVRQPA